MNEQQILQIIDGRINEKLYRYPQLPPHKHDGVDNIKIPAASIVPTTQVTGFITFDNNNTYTLYFPSAGQTFILLDGVAHSSSTGEWATVTGHASITKGVQWQPLNNLSVTVVGSKQYPAALLNSAGVPSGPLTLAQSSTNFYIYPGTNTSANGHVDDNYIVNIFDSTPSHIVTGCLQNVTTNSVDFQVTNLKSGWFLKANFTII